MRKAKVPQSVRRKRRPTEDLALIKFIGVTLKCLDLAIIAGALRSKGLSQYLNASKEIRIYLWLSLALH